MSQEIERKFLVSGEFKSYSSSHSHIIQGYLSTHPQRTVRVRIRDDRAFITVKGANAEGSFSHFEWEKEISVDEAKSLLELCEPGIIDKLRYLVPVGEHIYEVDEFHGAREGLAIAEIELSSEDEAFEKPDWLGSEVTGNPNYYNSALI